MGLLRLGWLFSTRFDLGHDGLCQSKLLWLRLGSALPSIRAHWAVLHAEDLKESAWCATVRPRCWPSSQLLGTSEPCLRSLRPSPALGPLSRGIARACFLRPAWAKSTGPLSPSHPLARPRRFAWLPALRSPAGARVRASLRCVRLRVPFPMFVLALMCERECVTVCVPTWSCACIPACLPECVSVV